MMNIISVMTVGNVGIVLVLSMLGKGEKNDCSKV